MAQREPAPDRLVTVQRFVNTLDVESGRDRLADTAGLLAFLRAEGLAGEATTATDEERARAVAVREALRELMHANHGEEPNPAAVALLNDAAERGRLVVCFDRAGRASLSPCIDGVDAAIGSLLAIVLRAMESGSWDDLKTCLRDSCQWAFYDRSKNHTGKWCSMEVCGSREKAKQYRARKKTH